MVAGGALDEGARLTQLERLREALAPEYVVERELAGGGMGVVYLGRDVALDRPVAIKILRPEHATATATERFAREARVLASLAHPNIVPVHHAGESRGLFYYIMDYIDAETLAQRLLRGPLGIPEAVALGGDLLAALEAAHARGVVHRDIKPSNIFLQTGRAVLADFGIAKTTEGSATPLTRDGHVPGTPGYMSPEQVAGREVGPATDLYAAGLVLHEAATGRRWNFDERPSHADWVGVPNPIARVLARALAWSPEARWPDAASMRLAFLEAAGVTSPRRNRRAALIAGVAASTALLLAGAVLLAGQLRPRASLPRIDILPFGVQGGDPALGDSLSLAVARSLDGSPDYLVRAFARGERADIAARLRLGGTASVVRDSLRIVARSEPSGEVYADVRGPLARWSEMADSVSYLVMLTLLESPRGPLAGDLPLRALPASPAGLAAVTHAELLFDRAQWDSAEAAYRRAAAIDPTCLLCDLRLIDIGRWLGRDLDTVRARRYLAARDSFPPRYRRLITASVTPRPARWDALERATARDPHFAFGWFARGDELFHRGPLDGHPRREALEALAEATRLRPDFAPAWEHLAWVAIAEGESTTARRALDQYQVVAAPTDPLSTALRALLEVGFAWRFEAPERAAQVTGFVLQQPGVGQSRDLAAGPAMLLTFDAPEGVVWVGRQFARRADRPDLVRAGLMAQVFGLMALGREDSARATARALRDRFGDPALALFAAELDGAIMLFDSLPPNDNRTEGRSTLAAQAEPDAAAPLLRNRAAWMLGLLAYRAGDHADAARRRSLIESAASASPLRTFLDATLLAATDPAAALRLSDTLTALDSAAQAGDPFFRAALHLARAAWHAALGHRTAAERELRWSENSDFVGYPDLEAQAAQVDWAFGTLARWDRARLQDAAGEADASTCRAYRDVARLWSGGNPPYAARAATAARRYAQLRCSPG